MPNHILNFPWLVATPNLCSNAHTHVFPHTHTHTHTTHISKLKEIERTHTHLPNGGRDQGKRLKETRSKQVEWSESVKEFFRRCRQGSTRMKYFVMLLQCVRVTYYWVGHGNLTGKPLMMGSRIGILL